jgi:GT2 family glycosyltransferase
MDLKIAILIPIYNGLDYTKQSLDILVKSIATSQWKLKDDINIIVIDDGSTDGSALFVKQNFPDVIICSGDGNLWWSGAINLGAKYAFNKLNCTYVLLWNNDIVPDPDYFSNLRKILQTREDALLFGSKILIKDTNRVWFMGGIFKSFSGKKIMIGLQQPDDEKYNKIIECDWLTGMGTIVHKAVIEKTGYWDQQNFPQYHGDSDFTIRAKRQGFSMYVFPELRIWNDITNTGSAHQFTWKSVRNSLKSLKSDFNFEKDWLFYRKYSTSFIAYFYLFYKYFRFIGGFIKNKYFSFDQNKKPK